MFKKKGYNEEFKKKIVNLYISDTLTIKELKKEFKVSKYYIYKWLDEYHYNKDSECNLEECYSGDSNWNDFSDYYLSIVIKDDSYNNLVKTLNDESIAAVISVIMGYEWIYTKTPILGNISAMDCMESELLTNRLKEALMRYPYS